MGHRVGESREQVTLFPVMLDDLVGRESMVRVIDAWVGALDLAGLVFAKSLAQVMGAPPYHPGDLLKLYIWGYLSAIRSSRALERECHRNVECMWLLRRLAPDHKTIAQFRRVNTQALVGACGAFVQFARSQRLIAGALVAIDGSKIRAVASQRSVLRKGQLLEQAQRNAQDIERYLHVLDEGDDHEGGDTKPRTQDVRRALEQLQEQQAQVHTHLQQIARRGGKNVVKGEPEAQVMGPSLNFEPGYNLQTAVESQSHLIVAHEVTNEANDQRQLQPMAEAASAALDKPVSAVADAGYANGEQIAQLLDKGILSYVAVCRAVNSRGDGTLYDKTEFHYDAGGDHFECPAGKVLKRKHANKEDNLVIYAARASDCGACANKPQCTTAARRFVSRHLYEDVLQANANRVAQAPQMMKLRRQTVEHPFADVKHRILGNARLLMRGLAGARSELSLAVLAYNIKRVFNMKGAHWMYRALQG